MRAARVVRYCAIAMALFAELMTGCGRTEVTATNGAGVGARTIGVGKMDMSVPVPPGTHRVEVHGWGAGGVEVEAQGQSKFNGKHSPIE